KDLAGLYFYPLVSVIQFLLKQKLPVFSVQFQDKSGASLSVLQHQADMGGVMEDADNLLLHRDFLLFFRNLSSAEQSKSIFPECRAGILVQVHHLGDQQIVIGKTAYLVVHLNLPRASEIIEI